MVLVLDPAADRLDELEELVRLPFRLADDEHVGIDLVVTFVQLVEEHVDSLHAVWPGGQYTTELRSAADEEAMTGVRSTSSTWVQPVVTWPRTTRAAGVSVGARPTPP